MEATRKMLFTTERFSLPFQLHTPSNQPMFDFAAQIMSMTTNAWEFADMQWILASLYTTTYEILMNKNWKI